MYKILRTDLVNKCLYTVQLNNTRTLARSSYCRKNTLLAQYSETEQKHILDALNNFEDSLSKLKISKNQHNAINSFLKEKKKFESLDEVLTLHGIGPNFLNRIRDGVLGGYDNKTNNNVEKSDNNKSTLTTPCLDVELIQRINTVTGIEIGNFYISWVRLDCKTKTVTNWNQGDLISSTEAKNLVNVYEFVVRLCASMPESDIYILESKNWCNMSSQTNLVNHIRAAQTSAMLVPLLNNKISDNTEFQNRVYFLKMYLSTRYFRTLIGQERVSPQRMVEDMFNGIFPAHCSPVMIKDACKELYFSNSKPTREALCQALLLAITFMDVVLLNKVETLRLVKARSKAVNNAS